MPKVLDEKCRHGAAKVTREEIERRWQEIDRELEELWAGKVCDDPAAREGELLREQDELEYEAGLLYFRDRDAGAR
jgi:hypothetical protein